MVHCWVITTRLWFLLLKENFMKTLKAFYVGTIILVGATVSFIRFTRWVYSVCKEIYWKLKNKVSQIEKPYFLAERTGFEPAEAINLARFPSVCLKPLDHLSKYVCSATFCTSSLHRCPNRIPFLSKLVNDYLLFFAKTAKIVRFDVASWAKSA